MLRLLPLDIAFIYDLLVSQVKYGYGILQLHQQHSGQQGILTSFINESVEDGHHFLHSAFGHPGQCGHRPVGGSTDQPKVITSRVTAPSLWAGRWSSM